MSKILEALNTPDAKKWAKQWTSPHVRKFLATGDRASLAKSPKLDDVWHPYIVDAMPDLEQWTPEATRVLQIARARNLDNLLGEWLGRHDKEPCFDSALKILKSAGFSDVEIRQIVVNLSLWDWEQKRPTPAARYYLKASDSEIKRTVEESYQAEDIACVLAHSAPDRLKKLLKQKINFGFESAHWLLWRVFQVNPKALVDLAYEVFQKKGDYGDRLLVIQALGGAFPKRFLKEALQESRTCLQKRDDKHHELASISAEYLLKHRAPDAVRVICEWMETSSDHWNASGRRAMVLEWAAENTPEHLRELAKACTRYKDNASVILHGLRRWQEAKVDSADLFHAALQRFFHTSGNSEELIAGIALAAEWNLAGTAVDLWTLLEHKSRPVRSAAARALAGLGYDNAIQRATELLSHKKTEIRQAAVLLFSQLGDKKALRDLKNHLDIEDDDDVRDSILLALERGGGAIFTGDERQARIGKTVSRTKTPPAPWIAPKKIQLFRRNGSPLSADETLYLLIRQSRCKEMRADLEARWLFEQLDREKSAPSAIALLQAFLSSKQDAADRWVLAFAGLAADDRLIPILRKSIVDWADKSRGKLAEYGVQALALLGTDAALMVIDSLSNRFRTKNRNIGQAASEAFATAAGARGVSVEELGDLVVPWLGFEPNKPRLITGGKAQLEARIGSDLKLTFRDTKTGKISTKLPSGVSAAIQSEFKLLAATLKEAVKAQQLRLETLLVRQFSWPVQRWRGLYPAHPLLLPFAQRLVWGWRDPSGKLKLTFRALEDATLTDIDDKTVELPGKGCISLIHPLDLDEKTRAAWVSHLSDYEIAPLFPQLGRPVVRVKKEETHLRLGKLVEGTELNAMTFRGRAEKLGWVRGSVGDAGSVSSYRKVFTGSNVEVFLGLEGMYMGMGLEDSVTLERFGFVRAGAIDYGSYRYDEPHDEKDARLIPFGEVPPIPYSEVLGDLVKISGKESDVSDT